MTFFAGCFAVFAGAPLPAGLLAGPLVDRFGGARLVPACLLPLAASLVVLSATNAVWAAPVFMALAGVTCGLFGATAGSLWAEVYGVRHLGAIRALATAVGVFATAGSPVLMGWGIDAGVTMETISLACAGYTLVAAAVARVALVPRRR